MGVLGVLDMTNKVRQMSPYHGDPTSPTFGESTEGRAPVSSRIAREYDLTDMVNEPDEEREERMEYIRQVFGCRLNFR